MSTSTNAGTPGDAGCGAPIVTVIALNLAYLIVGVAVVEVVFVYLGIGQLMVDAVSARDIPVVQACALGLAVTYILLNLTGGHRLDQVSGRRGVRQCTRIRPNGVLDQDTHRPSRWPLAARRRRCSVGQAAPW